jgi:hypothetical protein
MQERKTATDVISSSEILQRGHADLRHDMKHPRPSNESVSHPGVEMRVEVEVFTEGMDGHDGSADPFGEVSSQRPRGNSAIKLSAKRV